MNNLERAAELLESGWCQALLIDGQKVCLVGAVALSIGMTQQEVETEEGPVYDAVGASPEGKALRDEIIESGVMDTDHYHPETWPVDTVLYSYNDKWIRTQDEVVEMVKHAAKRLNPKD